MYFASLKSSIISSSTDALSRCGQPGQNVGIRGGIRVMGCDVSAITRNCFVKSPRSQSKSSGNNLAPSLATHWATIDGCSPRTAGNPAWASGKALPQTAQHSRPLCWASWLNNSTTWRSTKPRRSSTTTRLSTRLANSLNSTLSTG